MFPFKDCMMGSGKMASHSNLLTLTKVDCAKVNDANKTNRPMLKIILINQSKIIKIKCITNA